jgi:hypothetical protein
LSGAILLLILLNLAASYGMNIWNRAIFDALEKRDAATWSISPCRLLPHPAWAFPEQQTGRRPRVPFRGLLDCSAARWRPLSRGFGPVGYPTKSLVSYQINRQFSGWNSLHWCYAPSGRTAVEKVGVFGWNAPFGT